MNSTQEIHLTPCGLRMEGLIPSLKSESLLVSELLDAGKLGNQCLLKLSSQESVRHCPDPGPAWQSASVPGSLCCGQPSRCALGTIGTSSRHWELVLQSSPSSSSLTGLWVTFCKDLLKFFSSRWLLYILRIVDPKLQSGPTTVYLVFFWSSGLYTTPFSNIQYWHKYVPIFIYGWSFLWER